MSLLLGLHFEDIRILLKVLNQLVDRGNTIIIIEHNLDVIKQVDHIIDIGPEGGKHGGRLIDSGSPKEIIKNNKDILQPTFLKNIINEIISLYFNNWNIII